MAEYMLHFSASEAMWEKGGVLEGREQVDELTLGPFPDHIQLTYEMLRAGEMGDTVAWMVDGYWRVGEQVIPRGGGWTTHMPGPDALIFSDVVIVTT